MMSRLSVIALFTALLAARSAVLTCDNSVDAPPQNQATNTFTNLQVALDAASDGDTILVHGSDTNYGNVTIRRKNLKIVGAGYRPDRQPPKRTEVGNVTLGHASADLNASGALLIGLDIGQINGVNAADPIENITVRRCRVANVNADRGRAWKFINCILVTYISTQISPPRQVEELEVHNSIFTRSNCFSGFASNEKEVLVTNCLFMDATGTIFASQAEHLTFTNNIFYGVSPFRADNEFCTWNNNVSFLSSDDTFNTDPPNQGAGTNWEGTGNPEFVHVTPEFQAVDFSYDFDLHLEPTSPYKNAGTDGTDVGIYGGLYPWPDGGDRPWITSPMPAYPLIEEFDVQNANIPLDGTLRVRIKARKND